MNDPIVFYHFAGAFRSALSDKQRNRDLRNPKQRNPQQRRLFELAEWVAGYEYGYEADHSPSAADLQELFTRWSAERAS